MDSIQDPDGVHEILGNSPKAWIQKATDLLVASQVLFDRYQGALRTFVKNPEDFSSEIRVDTVAWMLRAMAAECLLKGVWLTRGQKLVNDGHYMKIPETNDHDLQLVAKKVLDGTAVQLDGKDDDLLGRLSLSIVDGRYPIHKTAEPAKMALRQKKGEDASFNKGWSYPKDHELFERLRSKIQSAMGDVDV